MGWVAGLVVFAVSLLAASAQTVSGPEPDGRPAGWREALDASLDLMLAKKYQEAVALFEQWVKSHPKFPEAHLMLGGAHEQVGRDFILKGGPTNRERAAKEFQLAVSYSQHAMELGGSSRGIAIRSTADLYGPYGLNRPAEREAFVRDARRRYPSEPRAHSELVSLLLETGRNADAEAAVIEASRAVPAAGRIELADSLWAIAGDTSNTSASEKLAREAHALLDALLKTQPDNIEALQSKAYKLRDEAKRVSEARAKALLAQATRLDHRIEAVSERRGNRGKRFDER